MPKYVITNKLELCREIARMENKLAQDKSHLDSQFKRVTVPITATLNSLKGTKNFYETYVATILPAMKLGATSQLSTFMEDFHHHTSVLVQRTLFPGAGAVPRTITRWLLKLIQKNILKGFYK